MKKNTAIILLILAAIIWGGGFVATKIALDSGLSVGILNSVRGLMFTLLVFAFFPKQILNMSKAQLRIGLLVGVFNFLGFLFQSMGAQYTAPSNSSFLTTTNVVMVPLLAWAMYKIKPKLQNFLAVAVCLFGMAILSGLFNAEFIVNIGDVYTIICALFFALSIVMLAKPPEGGHFAASAFLLGLTLFIGSSLYFIVFEKAQVPTFEISDVILPVIYLGVGSSFIAQTLQVLAQKYVPASTASLILLLEAVFGSIFSIAWGFESFTSNLLIGGSLILLSLVLSEIPLIKPSKQK